MSDLYTLLPTYTPTPTSTDLLSALESAHITTTDLLSQDALTLSRRLGPTTRSSVLDITRLTHDIAAALHAGTTTTAQPHFLTTGDATLDSLLGGGIRTNSITEFVGESGAGKSQFLLPLLLTSQLPEHLGGLSKPSIYISTESPLSTSRLQQLLSARPLLATHASLDNVHTVVCADLEAQHHILTYQLPVLAARTNAGLVVVDSVAANFRCGTARRASDVVAMAGVLRALARTGVAVVVANQVADRFDVDAGDTGEALQLDVQARWFNGWAREEQEGAGEGAKVPCLGLVWANALAVRVVVKRVSVGGAWRRSVAVVFSPWARGSEVEFEVWEGGVRALPLES